eukprot:gene29273-51237_t
MPAYRVVHAYVKYQVNPQTVLSLTANNLFDKLGYTAPDGSTPNEAFVKNNETLRTKVTGGAFPDVMLADWYAYTTPPGDWLALDGIHITEPGAFGLADYLSRIAVPGSAGDRRTGRVAVPAPRHPYTSRRHRVAVRLIGPLDRRAVRWTCPHAARPPPLGWRPRRPAGREGPGCDLREVGGPGQDQAAAVASIASWVMGRWPTWTLRGLARSATGMRTVSTPSWRSASRCSRSSPSPSWTWRRSVP